MALLIPPKVYKSKALNRYENMEFPDYEYQEYPMAITVGADEAGRPIQQIAENEEERAKLETGAEVVREADVRENLIQQCTNRGIQIDKRWTTDRIQRAIDEAAKK